MRQLAATQLLEHVQAALASPATCAQPLAQAGHLLRLLASPAGGSQAPIAPAAPAHQTSQVAGGAGPAGAQDVWERAQQVVQPLAQLLWRGLAASAGEGQAPEAAGFLAAILQDYRPGGAATRGCCMRWLHCLPWLHHAPAAWPVRSP